MLYKWYCNDTKAEFSTFASACIAAFIGRFGYKPTHIAINTNQELVTDLEVQRLPNVKLDHIWIGPASKEVGKISEEFPHE